MNDYNVRTGWRGAIRGNVLVMGVVSLLTDVSSEMIYPLLPIFISGLVPMSLAAVYVGLMEGVAESAASLLKVVFGWASDRLRVRKRLAVLGYALSSLSRPCIALATTGWHVVALRFSDRVGKGIRTSPRDALISDSAGKEVRGLAFSFHRAMDHGGAVLGSLAAILLLYWMIGHSLWAQSAGPPSHNEMSALRILFALALLPGLVATATLALRVREMVPSGTSPTESAAKGPKSGQLPQKFYLFLGVVSVFALGNSSDLFLLFYGRTRFGLSFLGVVALWIGLHLSKMVFSVPGGILSDKFGRRSTIVAGWIVYTAVYVGMAVVKGLVVFCALVIFYGLFYGLTEGSEKALVADYVKSEHRGRAFGLYHGAVGLAALPASLVFGVFWAKLGPVIAFTIGASLAGLATVLLILLLATPLGVNQPGSGV